MRAGQQVPLLGRDIPSVKAFKGTVTFAGRHQGTECSLVAPESANGKVPASPTCRYSSTDGNVTSLPCSIIESNLRFQLLGTALRTIAGSVDVQDVVILGTGAFALEAMEAANRAGAISITLITRPRDRYPPFFVE